jgi:hypothetical protein
MLTFVHRFDISHEPAARATSAGITRPPTDRALIEHCEIRWANNDRDRVNAETDA